MYIDKDTRIPIFPSALELIAAFNYLSQIWPGEPFQARSFVLVLFPIRLILLTNLGISTFSRSPGSLQWGIMIEIKIWVLDMPTAIGRGRSSLLDSIYGQAGRCVCSYIPRYAWVHRYVCTCKYEHTSIHPKNHKPILPIVVIPLKFLTYHPSFHSMYVNTLTDLLSSLVHLFHSSVHSTAEAELNIQDFFLPSSLMQLPQDWKL